MPKEQEKPPTWSQRKAQIRLRWTTPFQRIEWLCEWIAYRMSTWAFLDVLEYGGKLAVLAGMVTYITGGEERRQAAADQRKAKHYQAWQAINLASSQGGNAGRLEALEDLNNDGQSLAGVHLANAILPEIVLTNALLHHANFSNAILYKADLRNANLLLAQLEKVQFASANLNGAFLMGAFLQNASLMHADVDGAVFTEAHLENAHLDNLTNWQRIKSLSGANLSGVINPPEGFMTWAVEKMGAISNASALPNKTEPVTQKPQSQTSKYLGKNPEYASTNDYPSSPVGSPSIGPRTSKHLRDNPGLAATNDFRNPTPPVGSPPGKKTDSSKSSSIGSRLSKFLSRNPAVATTNDLSYPKPPKP